MRGKPQDIHKLEHLIRQYRLHWKHPELKRVLKRIEKGRLRPHQASRWLRKIGPWVEEQELRFDPFRPVPDQETLGHYDIEIGQAINSTSRVGFNLDKPRHAIIAGQTGSGKSNLIRILIHGIDAVNRGHDRLHRDPDS